MDHQVQGPRDLTPDRGQRELRSAEGHRFETGEHVPRTVGMSGGKRTVVSGVHRLEHIQRLTAAHLAHDDPVRIHAETGPDQVRNGNCAFTLRVGAARFQPHQIPDVGELQLRGILDGDDAFFVRDKRRKGIQKCGLTGIGPSADKDVVAGLHQLLKEGGGFRGDGAVADELFHRDGIGEFPDRNDRSAQRDRRKHNVDPASVLQARVRDGGGYIDDPVHTAHDLLDHVFQLLVASERTVPADNAPVLLHKDMILSVDHDLRDLFRVHELLQNVQPSKGIEKRRAQCEFFPDSQGGPALRQSDLAVDHFIERFVADVAQI